MKNKIPKALREYYEGMAGGRMLRKKLKQLPKKAKHKNKITKIGLTAVKKL